MIPSYAFKAQGQQLQGPGSQPTRNTAVTQTKQLRDFSPYHHTKVVSVTRQEETWPSIVHCVQNPQFCISALVPRHT